MRRLMLCAGIAAVALLGQCPDIEFFSARTVITTDLSSQTAIGVLYLHPGKFVAGRYNLFSPNKLMEVIPNYQRHMVNCFQKKSFDTVTPSAKDYSAGAGSQLALAADLDNNELFGVIWLGYQRSSVQVHLVKMLGLAVGTQSYTVGMNAASALFADVNGDGFDDLLVVNAGASSASSIGSVSVLLGNGDGTFRSAVEYPAGNNSTAIATGDFNGDGKLDIAVANSGENHISILAGNGDGTFKAATTVNTNGRPVALAAADLNGDGKLDLVVLSFGLMGTNTYSVLIGNGDGTFKAPMDTTLAAGGTYVAVGDFNLDGKADLAISHFNANTVSVFSGKGDGTFGSERLYLVGTNPGALVIQDVNGDGKPDIVVANGSSSVLLADPGSAGITTLLGNGDGTFQAAPSLPAGNEPAGVVAVDVNGDGKTDAVVSNQFGGELDVYLNDGKGGFGQPRRIAVTGLNGNTTSAFGIAAADFNGDGKIDVALADGINQDVTVLAGNGDGDFNPLTSVAMPAGAVSLTAADFNGDGKPDLAVATNNVESGGTGTPGVSIVLNGGGGVFHAPANIAGLGTPVYVATGDFNGDGKVDLAVLDGGMFGSATVPGGLYILLGKGDGTFGPPVNYAASVNPITVAVGDINGDGKLDLVIAANGANFAYQLGFFLGKGDGTFQAGKFVPTDFGPASIAIGDFNGDGKPDLIVAHCCGATDMTYLLGNGDGTFQPEVHFNGGNSTRAVAAADFNGDGKPDLAIANGTTPGSLAVLLNAKTVALVANVNAATFQDGPLAAESIVSAFGSHLASGTQGAVTLPLPTNILGNSVMVQDSEGKQPLADLFYVSPVQVNYEIPAGTADGTATVVFQASDGTTSTDKLDIVPLAPGLFFGGTLSQSYAAGNVIRVKPDGTQISEPVLHADASGKLSLTPIDLSSPNDQVVLVLFGTGLRNSIGKMNWATIAGTAGTVQFAGPQGVYAGLDQVNILLPNSLAGSGVVPVAFGSGVNVSNSVYVAIK